MSSAGWGSLKSAGLAAWVENETREELDGLVCWKFSDELRAVSRLSLSYDWGASS